METKVQHDNKRHKFYIVIENQEAYINYKLNAEEKCLDYYRTFVPPQLRNKGLAEKLAKAALEYAKNNNYYVNPSCSYVKKYIERNSEYQSLILG